MWDKIWNSSNRKVFICNTVTALCLNLFLEFMERKSVEEVVHFINDRTFVFLFNMLILFVCLSVVFIVKKKLFVWAAVTGSWFLVGLGNGIVQESRKTPFTAVDTTLARSVLPILNRYLTVWQICGAVIGIICIVILLVYLYLYSPEAKKTFDPRVNMSLFVLQLMAFFAILYMAAGRGMLIRKFDNLIAGYKDYGVAYGFCVTALDTGIDRPIDYSNEKVIRIDKKINKRMNQLIKKKKSRGSKESHVKTPNIIFLQLESFFDLSEVKKLNLSQDPTPVFRKVSSEYTSGYLKVPVYGAGTINTEFEVITGMNTEYFGTGEYPYRSVLQDKTCDSMAYWLQNLLYERTVIHNNNASFYDRDHILSNLGFDNFLTIENMNPDRINAAGWPEDAMLTDEILETMRQTKHRDLIYTISVQGHGDYPSSPPENPEITVTGPDLKEDYRNQLTYYACQIHQMDAFVGDLLDQLADYPEETIVIAYGDHLPGMDFKDKDLVSGSKYKTPYFIWDNFGLNKKKNEAGNVEETGKGNGEETGKGNGEGSGNGNGEGSGNGNGEGSGNGNGEGSGKGNGEETGKGNGEGTEIAGSTRNIAAWQLASAVMEELNIRDGIINRYHQTMKKTDHYKKNLKLIQYDLLYGADFISRQEGISRKPTEICFCLHEIRIRNIIPYDKKTMLYGQNFTAQSRVFINGRQVKARFHGPSVLEISSGSLHPGDKIVIRQVSRTNEKISLNETEPYVWEKKEDSMNQTNDTGKKDESD